MSIFDTKKVYFSNKYAWLCVVPILLLSFGLAIPHFMRDAVWFDEAHTHLYSGTGRVPPFSVIRSLILIARTDPWPPGYYLLNMAWGRFTGTSPFTDYVLPTLIGIIAIAVMYQLGKRFYGIRGGLIASAMVATSAFFIHYMHEARAYTLYLLAIAAIAFFYWTLLTRLNYRRRWLRWGFPLSIAAALYTHYVAGAFALGIIVYHLIFERPSRSHHQHMSPKRWADILRLWINGCILFAPWFAMLLGTLANEASDDRALPFLSFIGYALYGFSNNLWLILVPLVLSSLLLWKRPKIRFLWVWLITSLIVVFVINLAVSFLFHPRHILPYLVIIILLIIPVLFSFDTRFKGASTLLVALFMGAGIIYSTSPDFMYTIPTHIVPMPLTATTDMMTTVDACVNELDRVILSIDTPDNEGAQEVAVQYYFGLDSRFTQLGQLVTDLDEDRNIYIQEDEVYEERVAAFVSESEQVWLMTLPDLPDTDNLLRLDTILENQGYHQCPILSQYQHASIWFYTIEDNCDVITNSCQ